MRIVNIYKNLNNNFKAILAMILAVLCVTIMSVQAKLIGIEYHPVQIAFELMRSHLIVAQISERVTSQDSCLSVKLIFF